MCTIGCSYILANGNEHKIHPGLCWNFASLNNEHAEWATQQSSVQWRFRAQPSDTQIVEIREIVGWATQSWMWCRHLAGDRLTTWLPVKVHLRFCRTHKSHTSSLIVFLLYVHKCCSGEKVDSSERDSKSGCMFDPLICSIAVQVSRARNIMSRFHTSYIDLNAINMYISSDT